MRPVGAISKFLGFAVAVAAMMSASTAQAVPEQNQAVVRAVRGSANYSADRGANWRKLNVGAKLNQNSVIRTAPGSTVDLFLGDNGPVVRVTEDTTLGIDKLTVDRTGVEKIIETQLDLRSGRILGNVKKLANASKYEVKTPQGVAGIRGTRYDIRADGTVTVVEGQVVVVYIVNGQPVTATVNAGYTARPPVQANQPVVITPVSDILRNEIDGQLDEAGRTTVVTTDAGQVIVTVEPIIEALQEGDPAKIETPFGPGNNSPTGGGE